MGTEIRPFRIEVSEADLDDLRERLARTRWPPDPGAAGTTAPTSGTCGPCDVAHEVRLAQEDRFNRWPHHLTIDGQQIHFIRGPTTPTRSR
jgi:hypothetical protein